MSEGVELKRPATDREFRVLRQSIGAEIPRDLEALLRATNGFDCGCDRLDFCLYSTSQMVKEFELTYDGRSEIHLLRFGDYLINSIDYGIDVGPHLRGTVLCENGTKTCSPSLGAFLKGYLEDPLRQLYDQIS